jgi:hypothetical protein
MRQGIPADDEPLPVELKELFGSYRESMAGIDAVSPIALHGSQALWSPPHF